jgi:hypothetical protein
MLNLFSTSSDLSKNVNKPIQSKPLNNNFNKEKSLKKTLKSVELSLMKFFLTVWSTFWVLSTKVMRTSEMRRVMKKEKVMKTKNKKQLKTKSQNLKEKISSQLEKKLSLKKNQNARTNECEMIRIY